MRKSVAIEAVNIDRSALRLTDTILGYDEDELSQTLKAIARGIGLRHIAYLRFPTVEGVDVCPTTSVATYPSAWRTRYFFEDYARTDPIVARGRNALLPFDWGALASSDPVAAAFLADAAAHGVGVSGLSIPVRNRTGAHSLVSYSSDHTKTEWARYKRAHMVGLQKLSWLIDSAADACSGPPLPAVALSPREQECLIWAARGKSAEEIGDVMKIGFGRVRAHLDAARHKLHCMSLTHAIAVAFATGVVPATALRSS